MFENTLVVPQTLNDEFKSVVSEKDEYHFQNVAKLLPVLPLLVRGDFKSVDEDRLKDIQKQFKCLEQNKIDKHLG